MPGAWWVGALGFALFDSSPWFEVCATAFGIGAGLTIDEFALWIYLDDVYWAREGRRSVDAAVIAASAMLLVLVGARPFGLGTGSAAGVVTAVIAIAVLLLLVGICLAKERVLHGVVGAFFPPVAVYGAARIGKPRSPWARRLYAERNPRKQAKAERRFRVGRRTQRLKDRFRDAVGGKTEEVYRARRSEAAAIDEAGSEVRRRAERYG